MQLLGASAPEAREVCRVVTDAVLAGRAVVLVSDGEDVSAFVADEGDEPGEVQRVARVHVGQG